MTKTCLAMSIIAAMISCSIGLSAYTYIGPYYVEFNDTSHPIHILSSCGYIQLSPKDLYSEGYYGFDSTDPSNATDIIIFEGDSIDQNDDFSEFLAISPDKGFREVERLNRLINGYEAIVTKHVNESNGWITHQAAFTFPVWITYSGRDRAIVRIKTINYTDYEFDRFLDTFKIYRLKEP